MAKHRALVRTVLAVGEGKAECLVLERVKSLYLPRGSGTRMKVVGGYGKGGKGVLDFAVSYAAYSDHDLCLAPLDTDANWDDTQRARARREHIEIVESHPGLEAWLLSMHGQAGERSSAGHKRHSSAISAGRRTASGPLKPASRVRCAMPIGRGLPRWIDCLVCWVAEGVRLSQTTRIAKNRNLRSNPPLAAPG